MTSTELREEILSFLEGRGRTSFPDMFDAIDGDIGDIFLATRRLYRDGTIERVGPGEYRDARTSQDNSAEQTQSDFRWQTQGDFRWQTQTDVGSEDESEFQWPGDT